MTSIRPTFQNAYLPTIKPQKTGGVTAFDVTNPTNLTDAAIQDPTLQSAQKGYETIMNLWENTPKGDGTAPPQPDVVRVALGPCTQVRLEKENKVKKPNNEWMSGLSCYSE